MNRIGDRLVGEHQDDLLDQAPAGEMDDIAMVPAAVGAQLRLRARILAEAIDQLGRVIESGAVGNMDVLTQGLPPVSFVSTPGNSRRRLRNAAFPSSTRRKPRKRD